MAGLAGMGGCTVTVGPCSRLVWAQTRAQGGSGSVWTVAPRLAPLVIRAPTHVQPETLHLAASRPIRCQAAFACLLGGFRDFYLKVIALYIQVLCLSPAPLSLLELLQRWIYHGAKDLESFRPPPRPMPAAIFTIWDFFFKEDSPNYLSFRPHPLVTSQQALCLLNQGLGPLFMPTDSSALPVGNRPGRINM